MQSEQTGPATAEAIQGMRTQLAGQSAELAQSGVDRRRLFRAIGAAAVGAVGAMQASQSAQAAGSDVSGDFDPRSLVEKLVNRVCFAPTAADYQLAKTLGYHGYLEYQLNYQLISDPQMPSLLAPYPLILLNAPQTFARVVTVADTVLIPQEQAKQLRIATFVRAAMSRRQLYERMVEFWSDHFSIHPVQTNAQLRVYKTSDDRDVIRPNAMRTFRELQMASSRSPAMLHYLNNDTSEAGAINENYAREIMELHTISPAVPYTRDDIRAVARAFTGWTVKHPDYARPNGRVNAGSFIFRPEIHDSQPRTVLGRTFAGRTGPAGEQDAIDIINFLVDHPATARFIASKLVQRFLGEGVSPRIVDRVALAFTQTGGDIKEMLRVVFMPKHLADAPPRLKRPIHLFAHAIRSLGILPSPGGVEFIVENQLAAAAHIPFGWRPPNGYPDRDSYWANPIPRWNFAILLSTNVIEGATYNLSSFFESASTLDEMMSVISQKIFNGRLPADQAQAIRGYLAVNPLDPYRRLETIGLALSSNTFQWC